MDDSGARSSGIVIAFPDLSSRPRRPPLLPGEARGEILLFTGIRYERPPQPGPFRPVTSEGPTKRRRQP